MTTEAEVKKAKESVVSCASMLGIMPASVAVSLFQGFVMAKLWLWFLVPFGFPAVSVAVAWAVGTLIAMNRGTLRKKGTHDISDLWHHEFGVVLACVLNLALGWFLHMEGF